MIRLVAKQLIDENCRLIESAKISSCSLDEKILESLFTSCEEENDLQQRKVKSLVIVTSRLLYFARGLFRFTG